MYLYMRTHIHISPCVSHNPIRSCSLIHRQQHTQKHIYIYISLPISIFYINVSTYMSLLVSHDIGSNTYVRYAAISIHMQNWQQHIYESIKYYLRSKKRQLQLHCFTIDWQQSLKRRLFRFRVAIQQCFQRVRKSLKVLCLICIYPLCVGIVAFFFRWILFFLLFRLAYFNVNLQCVYALHTFIFRNRPCLCMHCTHLYF